jgi:DNA-binding MarR family transcriptional regulator
MPKQEKLKRTELLQRLWELGRRISTQTVFLHQAIAQGFGLNATDTKCIDLILQSGDEPVTAGWLSQQSGLTTGAITHILDRLEKRQYIERVRDTEDRRRVFVRIRIESLKPMIPKYEAIGEAYRTILNDFSDQELRLICDYMEKSSEVSKQELARIVNGTSARAGGKAGGGG